MFQRRFLWSVILLALASLANAQTYMPFKLVDGTVVNGRIVAAQDAFAQVAMEGGGYTNLNWARLSQETLRMIQTNRSNPSAAQTAGYFIDPPRSRVGQGRAAKPVTIGEVPRLDRPASGGLFASPVMVLLLFVLYAANIYAAFEIAIFRQQPPALVCVVAAVVPLLGPAIFLAMPTRLPPEEHPAFETVEEAPAAAEEPVAPAPEAGGEAGLSLHVEQPAVPAPVVYARGQFTFNRRFFETKFAGFMKMVPGEAERDKVIVIKSSRGEYVGHRLSKCEPNEVYLQIRKGNASEEVMIPFTEIYEVVVKHKDS